MHIESKCFKRTIMCLLFAGYTFMFVSIMLLVFDMLRVNADISQTAIELTQKGK